MFLSVFLKKEKEREVCALTEKWKFGCFNFDTINGTKINGNLVVLISTK